MFGAGNGLIEFQLFLMEIFFPYLSGPQEWINDAYKGSTVLEASVKFLTTKFTDKVSLSAMVTIPTAFQGVMGA